MQTVCFNIINLSLDSSPGCRPQISTTAQGGWLVVNAFFAATRWQLEVHAAANIASCACAQPCMSDRFGDGRTHRQEGIVGGHDVVLLAEGPGSRRALLRKLLRPPLRRRVLGAELIGPGVRGVGLLLELVRPGGAPALALLHPSNREFRLLPWQTLQDPDISSFWWGAAALAPVHLQNQSALPCYTMPRFCAQAERQDARQQD